jgi:hypothetical protein
MTSKTPLINGKLALAWNRSDILFTKTNRGDAHRDGSINADGCSVVINRYHEEP